MNAALHHQQHEAKLYDLTTIEAISGGSKEFIHDMMQLFIETMPSFATQMVDGLKTQNWASIKSVAHQVKPTIELMGISSLVGDIKTIETNAKDLQGLDVLPGLIEKFYDIINKVVEALRVEIKFYA